MLPSTKVNTYYTKSYAKKVAKTGYVVDVEVGPCKLLQYKYLSAIDMPK